jgi:dimethylaniline monooxygenase (N-oxide forming)
METHKVAIIGAGISGIVSAKYAKENGFTPIIFDKNSTIGGVWSKDGQAWPNLETNISKYSCQFSDHSWKDEDPIFIPKEKMDTWLLEYVEKFGLTNCLNLNTKVLNISKELEKFKITYEKGGAVFEEVFPYVIVATGFFNKPNFIGFEKFKNCSNITIEHSCQYTDPRNYTGKKVICVGASHSAIQIAEQVCQYSDMVYSIFRQPSFIIPKSFYSNDLKKVIFNDYVSMSNREVTIRLNNTPQNEKNKIGNNFKLTLSSQNKFESLKVEKDCEEPLGTAICQTYIAMAQKDKIKPIRAELADITEEGVRLTNGQIIQADAIILGTGYKSDLSFIDESVLKELHYDPVKDTLALDGLNVVNTEIKGLAFVGLQYCSTFITFELQARLALKYFLNQYKPKDLLLKPYTNYKTCYYNYILRLAEQLEVEPELEAIKKDDPELYDYLMKGPIMPQHFKLDLNNPDDYKINSELIKKWNRMFKDENVNFFV